MISKIKQIVAESPRTKLITAKVAYSGMLERVPGYRAIYDRYIRKKVARFEKKPSMISINLTNRCNARCTICFRDDLTKAQGVMDQSMACDIIDQAAAWGVPTVHFSPFGEPLLHPDLISIAAYAKQKIPRVGIITNGSLLIPALSERLIGILDYIWFSMDGYDAASFEAVRKGLTFNVIVENIRYLRSIRAARNSDRPELAVFYTITPKTYGKSYRMKAFWSDKVDHVTSHFQHAWGGGSNGRVAKSAFNHSKYRQLYPCDKLWDIMVVDWDGRVPLCCLDFDTKMEMGRLQTDSLMTIWHNSRFQASRTAHQQGDRCRIPICDRCTAMPWWWGKQS